MSEYVYTKLYICECGKRSTENQLRRISSESTLLSLCDCGIVLAEEPLEVLND